MIDRFVSSPLDDFLADTGSSDGGQRLQQLGLIGSLTGVLVAIGVIVFLHVVHRGSRREVAVLLQLVGGAGALTIVGACVEVAGVASVGDVSWFDALTDVTGRAPLLRLVAGLLVLFGVQNTASAAETNDGEAVRWRATLASTFGLSGLAVGAFSFWFDGHTQTEGVRVAHAAANLAHVGAGGVWLGGVVALALCAWIRRDGNSSVGGLTVRFANVATFALVVVALAGSLMTLMIIDGVGDLTGTDWGRALLVKVAAVAVTAAIGGYNHFRVVPALERRPDDPAATVHLRRTATIETAILVGVALLTVWLSTASTN